VSTERVEKHFNTQSTIMSTMSDKAYSIKKMTID